MTSEDQLAALRNARTKQELFEAASSIVRGPEVADPELLAGITLKLRTYVNAAPAPEFAIPFSIQLVMQMGKGLGPSWYIALSSSAWPKLMGDDQAYAALDPAVKRSHVLAGHLAVLYGVYVYTDAYYHPELKILPADHLYVMSADGTKGYAVRLA